MTPTPEAMVETVARAMYVADQKRDVKFVRQPFPELHFTTQDMWRNLARAAIRALAPVIAEAYDAGIACGLSAATSTGWHDGSDIYAARIIATLTERT